MTRLIAERSLDAKSLAVEVASNDGYLLQYYAQAGVPVLGIEPARNVAEIARGARRAHGRGVLRRGARREAARRRPRARTSSTPTTCSRTSPTSTGSSRASACCSPTTASWSSESPYLGEFLRKIEFDTIYHEHLCYYSLTALVHLFRRHGLEIEDCEHAADPRRLAADLRASMQRSRDRPRVIATQLDEERRWGVDRDEPYARSPPAGRAREARPRRARARGAAQGPARVLRTARRPRARCCSTPAASAPTTSTSCATESAQAGSR